MSELLLHELQKPTNGKMKRVPASLVLDCWEDALSETQQLQQNKMIREYKEFQRKMHEVYDMVNVPQSGLNVPSQPINTNTTNHLMLQGGQINGSYVVVEPNSNQLKLVVQSLASSQASGHMITSNAAMRMATNTTPAGINRPGARLNMADFNRPRSTYRPKLLFSSKGPVPQAGNPAFNSIQIQGPQKKKLPLQESQNQRVPAALRPANRKVHNTEVVDLTLEDIRGDESSHVGGIQPDSEKREDAPEKTFPSLVVVARAHLSSKTISSAEESAARGQLDAMVKRVLVLGPTALTEWLLQQKLIRSSQKCSTHGTELKLGMYSDTSRLPHSGGYVWVSECCPTVITSVFAGSIFEAAPYAPAVLLKLIYHWACQTSVQNVLMWVRVTNIYLKTMYTNLRAVCTAAIHHHFPRLGGHQKFVEVGLISLGTTTGDGVLKQVKVEVLGVYDQETGKVRLKAMEPVQDSDKFKRKKFLRILEPLKQWIVKTSTIVTDICADDPAWKETGFLNVKQSSANGPSNKNIMTYIRNIVPRMFQNTLSLLSRQIIQQFLDELVWRETWGPIPSMAHDRMIKDLAELTKLDTGGTLISRLGKISSNPLKNWSFGNWQSNCNSKDTQGSPSENMTPSEPFRKLNNVVEFNNISPVNNTANNKKRNVKMVKVHNDESNGHSAPGRDGQVYLESYYYGTFEGEKMSKQGPLYTECAICLKEFRDSAQFSDHLILHALNEQYPYVDATRDICRICLTVPDTTMNAHVNQHHKDNSYSNLTCKICNIPYKSVTDLIEHMTSTHNELELPYTCDICYFRTSIFEDVQTHFNTKHKNSNSAQCPFCLKLVSFIDSVGQDITRNQLYFVRHIQRHQLPFAKKCDRCALSFINTMLLRDHQEKKHSGCKTAHGMSRYNVIGGGILMPDPQGKTIPFKLSEKDDDTLYIEHGLMEPRSNDDHPVIKENLSFLLCRECDGPLIASHYTSTSRSCEKCNYKTNCCYALSEHILTWHGSKNINESQYHHYEKGNCSVPIQEKPLHCGACLFTSSNGNDMASHISKNCPNAYCTKDKRKVQVSLGLDIAPEVRSTRDRSERSRKRKARNAYSTRRSKRRSTVNRISTLEEEEDDDYLNDICDDSRSASVVSGNQTEDSTKDGDDESASD